ncbi:MAG TPA: DUF998 domain-containing protein [Ktedonobacteraceae bacterium]|nr:DUF998 domain-containing protein [Ktedonobacteraceae bacterium]
MNTIKTSSTVPGEQRKLALRLSLWAGIIGPLFFVLVFTIDGFLTPGYSAMRDVVSFLELGSNGWIQRLNFMLTGLLLILFAPLPGMSSWQAVCSCNSEGGESVPLAISGKTL